MSPLPTTKIFHRDWAERHRPSVKTSFTAACKVMRKGEGEPVFDPETGDTIPPAPQVVYEGPCNIEEIQREAQRIWAGQQGMSRETYRISLEIDAGPFEYGEDKDWVEITEADNDPQAVGKHMWIEHVVFGSERWSRELICWIDSSRASS